MTDEITVEATGETVGEAKWSAVRELQRRVPGLDREAIRFQVVSEGERGLLGVGYTPASVVATADVPDALAPATASQPGDTSQAADRARAPRADDRRERRLGDGADRRGRRRSSSRRSSAPTSAC